MIVARTLQLAAVPLLVGMLGACVAGPDYRGPVGSVALTPAATAPFQGAATTAFADAPLPRQWWKLYRDARLDAFVDEALRANADLRAADANLRRASALVREAEAARGVQTTQTGSADVARVGGYTLPLPGTEYSYLLGTTLSVPLDFSGGIRRGIEAADDQAQAALAARDQVRVVVAAAVTRAYASACSANRSLAASERVLAIQKQTLDVTQRLAKGGRGTAFNVSRAEAAVSEHEASLPPLIASRRTALYELAVLMGRAPTDYPLEAEHCSAPPELTQTIPVGDGWALIQRRADIRQADRLLAAATANIGVETSQLYPQVSLGGSVGFSSSVSSFMSAQSLGATLGPLVTWAFPNRKAVRARIEAAGAGADEALAHYDSVVLNALKQTESALSSYSEELEREAALERATRDAALSTTQAGRLYHFGRINFVDVLTAEASLANAESALATARAESVDKQIDLFLALGGGWQPQETDTGDGHARP